MYCRKCGAELKPNAKFCSKCGSPVFSPQTIKKPKAPIAFILLTACIVIGVVVFNAASMHHERNGEVVESATADFESPIGQVDYAEDETEVFEEPESEQEAVEASAAGPEESVEVSENDPPVLDIDVEDEVKQIREWFYGTQNNISSYEQSTVDNATIYYQGQDPVKIVVKKGTDGWDYAREYYYHDGVLYFAFIFNGGNEHRLYFKEDQMIRYIDQDKNIYNYGETDGFSEWETPALQEAYSLLQYI